MSADGAGPHHHGSRTVVLFEGRSDIAAFQAVARRHGASLAGLELARFRVFQEQPAQRGRPITDQLHRFAGTAAGRKTRFAADVVEAIPFGRLPRPLTDLLEAALHPR